MLLIPAIDLKDGHCVRLKQGDMENATVFSEDPAQMARHWLEQGARRLHLVDLNGAFAGKPKNEGAVKAIIKAVQDYAEEFDLPEIPVQLVALRPASNIDHAACDHFVACVKDAAAALLQAAGKN